MNESTMEMLEKISKPVRFAAAAALAMLALFLFVRTTDAVVNFGSGTPFPVSTITVDGTGKSSQKPDIATISFSVTESGVTVAEAQTKATTKTDAALKYLKDAKIADKDVKTTGYNVYPKYENQQPCYNGGCAYNSNPKIIGYEVSQSVTVKVRDTDKAGDVLQGLGNTGVQNISGPNFTVDDEDASRAAARKEAIDEARAKAQVLANQLGVRLGKVVSFNEGGGMYPMAYDAMNMKTMSAGSAEMMPAPSLPTGENETSVSVSITYEIK